LDKKEKIKLILDHYMYTKKKSLNKRDLENSTINFFVVNEKTDEKIINFFNYVIGHVPNSIIKKKERKLESSKEEQQ
jgi:hypothetical protein